MRNYWFDTTNYKELIHINIKHNQGYFEFFIPKDRVASTSARMFALMDNSPSITNDNNCNHIFKKSNQTNCQPC